MRSRSSTDARFGRRVSKPPSGFQRSILGRERASTGPAPVCGAGGRFISAQDPLGASAAAVAR